ncbi:MAG: MFS transporter [Gammaproteobacteria bacterium]|nr:MFS transporter [Gammaproteobacteria bacterium]
MPIQLKALRALPATQKSLLLMTIAMTLAFQVWSALLNNFAVEQAGFTGREIGILHSLREIPGFLAFAVVLLLVFIREKTLALTSLALLGIATAATGYFPSILGLYVLTVLSSIGFHYYETVNQSLTLQWIDQSQTSQFLGLQIGIASAAAIVAYTFTIVADSLLGFTFSSIYFIAGLACLGFAWLAKQHMPQNDNTAEQHTHLFLRKRYWLYYVMVFLSGARRQIFTVFAGFLMVEKFGYSASAIAGLFLINCVVNVFFAPAIGRLVAKIGERRALIIEYIGLIIVFISYGLVESSTLAAGLYVIDHLLFAMAIALKSYFKKIADPRDMAGTASVSFTINHIAAVVLPAALGLLWLSAPSMVFYVGALIAACSLLASLWIPRHPHAGHEVSFSLLKPAS